jgi:hypothetical protein
MSIRGEIEDRGELQEAVFTDGEIREGLKIEELLRLAHEIHRAHGGLFGYDLEDWLEAEREVTTRNRQSLWAIEQEAQSGSEDLDQRKGFARCAGQHN